MTYYKVRKLDPKTGRELLQVSNLDDCESREGLPNPDGPIYYAQYGLDGWNVWCVVVWHEFQAWARPMAPCEIDQFGGYATRENPAAPIILADQ